MTEYAFVYFDDKDDEMDFVRKHGEEIIDMMIRCFAPENEYENIRKFGSFDDVIPVAKSTLSPLSQWLSELKDELSAALAPDEVVQEVKLKSQWFFVMDYLKKNLIAVCKLKSTEKVSKTNKDIRTYEVFHLDEKPDLTGKYVTVGPCIDALCKKSGYKGAGAFLLEHMHKYLRMNKIKKVYLVPESMRSKEAQYGYKNGWNCELSDSYYQDNQRLVKFYQRIGYQHVPKTYFIEYCDKFTDEVIAYSVMEFDLEKVD